MPVLPVPRTAHRAHWLTVGSSRWSGNMDSRNPETKKGNLGSPFVLTRWLELLADRVQLGGFNLLGRVNHARRDVRLAEPDDRVGDDERD